MDEGKLAIIVYQHDIASYQRLMGQLSLLEAPEIHGQLVDVEVVTVAGKGGRAAAYNAGMRQSSARYKVYLDTAVAWVNPELLKRIIDIFKVTECAGMIGFFGSSLPLNGDFRHAKRKYGHFAWANPKDGNVMQTHGEAGIFNQRVQAVDAACLATCVDVPWDEEVHEDFLATAHVLSLQAEKWETVVPVDEEKDLYFVSTRMSPYFAQLDETVFEQARQRFIKRYAALVQPLVSILIPAYNQPEFCREALESALQQEYENIEIVIGDDSTDDRVQAALAPLLEQHANIRYFYRGNLAGENAFANIRFLLNECHGGFVNLLFHDDLIYPSKIRKMMALLVEDIDEEIAFVTSKRESINAEGQSQGVIDSYGWSEDRVFTGLQLCPKMLLYRENIVGEMSTVLLRKSLLRGKDGYDIGIFYGYQDPSMGDVSTWLELLRDGHICVFLQEKLSAFRDHSEQNTHDPDTILLCLLDWLNFAVLAYLHRTYLREKADFKSFCDGWGDVVQPVMSLLQSAVSPAKKAAIEICQQEAEAILRKDYHEAIRLSIRYMSSTGADPKEFLAGITEKELCF